MEYDPSLGINAVRFYAYHADLPNFDGTLFKNPALDSEGPKFLPQLCIACHGGSYNGSTHNVEGASFLPFDVLGSNFLYDTGPDNYSLANQQGQFRALNHIVKETHPNSTNINNPIVQLINGLYPCGSPEGGCDASDTPTPFTPPGWAGHEALYQTIPRVYCRTCHVAQPSFRDWTSYADFSSSPAFIKSIVCVTRGMPHAEIPFKKFWLSTNPHAPAYLSGSTGLNFGACPP
jgi:hypothetical protein